MKRTKKEKAQEKQQKKERNYNVIQQGIGAKRRIVIETDGRNINVAENSLSPLESCEVLRRALKYYGGIKDAVQD